jgi:hypothetical protein
LALAAGLAVLLRNELAAIVGTDLRRAPDLLDENLERLPGTILRAEQVGKMTTGVVVGQKKTVVVAVVGLHIKRTLKIRMHQAERVAGAREMSTMRATAYLAG